MNSTKKTKVKLIFLLAVEVSWDRQQCVLTNILALPSSA